MIFSFPKAFRDHQGDFKRTSFEVMKTIKSQNDVAEVHPRIILPVVQRSVSEKEVKMHKTPNENSCLLFKTDYWLNFYGISTLAGYLMPNPFIYI